MLAGLIQVATRAQLEQATGVQVVLSLLDVVFILFEPMLVVEGPQQIEVITHVHTGDGIRIRARQL